MRVASFLARFWRPRAFFPLGIVVAATPKRRIERVAVLVARRKMSGSRDERAVRVSLPAEKSRVLLARCLCNIVAPERTAALRRTQDEMGVEGFKTQLQEGAMIW